MKKAPHDDANAATPVIFLDRITVRVRDRHILAGTTWRILPGAQWAVIGPNGAGKSTLVKAAAGLAPVVAGTAHRDGIPGGRIPTGYLSFERHRDLIAREDGMDHARHFSGRLDDVTTVNQWLGTAPGAAADFSGTVLDITHLGGRPIRHLSTGEIRKVLLFDALRRAPRLLILDEPFDGLDPPSRQQLRAAIETLMQRGQQVILVTHRMADLPRGITHVLEVRDGAVFRQGPIADMDVPGSERLRKDIPAIAPAAPLRRRSRSVEPASAPLIDMRRVTVAYGAQVILKQVDWRVMPGENWAVAGPNGAGKSTLLSLVTADNPQAYANDIRLFGRRRGSGESIWVIKARMGHVSSAVQIGYRTGITAENVVVSGFFDSIGLFRQATAAQRQTAQLWMTRLGIGHLAARPFDQLSHGEQRMVLLTRAIVKDPSLLILDEPCQGLDPQNRLRVLDLVERIGSRTAATVIFVTHYPEEIMPCITHELVFELAPEGGYRTVARSR
ncbi:MAG: ATP-binding cassette domain-containing protein [Pseudomonadota bacterium]